MGAWLKMGEEFLVIPRSSDDKSYFGNGGEVNLGPDRTSSVIGMNAAGFIYFNGSDIGDIPTAANVAAIATIGVSTVAATGGILQGSIQAITFYNVSLTPAQILAISGRMALLPF